MIYEKLALITKSDEFHGHMIPKIDLLQALGAAIAAINALDAFKTTLFYGRAYPLSLANVSENCNSIASGWRIQVKKPTQDNIDAEYATFSEQRAIDVIHAIIGTATEAGEGLELLLATIKTKEFDIVNAAEETFDGQWYNAIMCNAIATTFEHGQAQNIAKLKKRFGAKFDAYAANNRDLTAERKTLEHHGLNSGDLASAMMRDAAGS